MDQFEGLFYKKDCTDCELGEISKENKWYMVVGKGNTKAKILMIGEAAGEQEAIEGKPFVGRAGKMLDNILQALNLTLEDVFITNTIMHRPVMKKWAEEKYSNRQPNEEELTACKQYLINKIDYIKPKLIIALGKVATHWLFPDVSIDRGTIYRFSLNEVQYPVLPLYHPAALLYNSNNKREMEEHVKKHFDYIKSIKDAT